jgi:NAD(P) transhydrogenase beta subunit
VNGRSRTEWERNAAIKMSIGGENYQRSIIPILSDTSRFSGGSLRPGFAGVDNDLYYNPKCMMLFGDTKESLNQLFAALKS